MKNKIVLTENFYLTKKDKEKLSSLGDVIYFQDLAKNKNQWLDRCKKGNIICTKKKFLKENLNNLKNIFLSLPFTDISFIDKKILIKNKITASFCPACNSESVSEWIIFMTLELFRNLNFFNRKKDIKNIFQIQNSLVEKKVLILGKGNIGKNVGKILKSFKMKIDYFQRGDKLLEKIKDKDLIINTLSFIDKKQILNRSFFIALKKNSFFISVANTDTFDIEAMIEAVDKKILQKVAIDEGKMIFGNIQDENYKKLLKNKNILLTPHIAFNTDNTIKKSNQMMIKNIENYLKNKPINLI